MPSTIKLSITAKGLSTIILGLIAMGGAILSATIFTDKYDFSKIDSELLHEQKRQDVHDYLHMPLDYSDDNPTPLQDLPELIKEASTLKSSLDGLKDTDGKLDALLAKHNSQFPPIPPEEAPSAQNLMPIIVKADYALSKALSYSDNFPKSVRAPDINLTDVASYGAIFNKVRYFAIEQAAEVQTSEIESSQKYPDMDPDDWILNSDEQLLKAVAQMWDRQPIPEIDMGLKAFDNALTTYTNTDDYCKRLPSMRLDSFLKNYDAEEAHFNEEIDFSSGSLTKVVSILPPLPGPLCIHLYPWAICGGMTISLILIARFRSGIRKGFSLELDDPGFPANLILYQPASRSYLSIGMLITLILVALPVVITEFMQQSEQSLCDQISQNILTPEKKQAEAEEGFDTGRNEEISKGEKVVLDATPSGWDIFGVTVAATLSLATFIQLERTKNLVAHQGPAPTQPQTT